MPEQLRDRETQPLRSDQPSQSQQDSQDSTPAIGAHYDTRLPDLPWSRRAQIPLIAAAVYSVIRTLGPTLRFEVLGWQHAERRAK